MTRAITVLSRHNDIPIEEVAANAGCGITTVKKWMGRFLAHPQVESLYDRPRSVRPYTIPASVKVQVAAMACAEPRKNFAVTGHHVSPSSVQRILSNRQIKDVHIVSVDEKTGMQAIERRYPSKPPRTGVDGRREYEYILHGTQSLIAAFDVLSGGVWGHCGDTRTAEDLLEFMEDLAKHVYPEGQVIIIWDNLNIHGGERWEEFNKRHGGRRLRKSSSTRLKKRAMKLPVVMADSNTMGSWVSRGLELEGFVFPHRVRERAPGSPYRWAPK